MAKSFFDFCDEKPKQNSSETYCDNDFCDAKKTSKPINEEELKENIGNTYNKYKDLNQDDLMSEFLRVSRQQKRNGSLNESNMQNLINQLSPFLNQQQKEKLKDLLNKIDE